MPEEVLFESETKLDRSDIATYLRTVADNLDAGDDITLSAGEQSITLDVPATSTFEVKVEREGPSGKPGELSVEFELEWKEGDEGTGGSLEIE